MTDTENRERKTGSDDAILDRLDALERAVAELQRTAPRHSTPICFECGGRGTISHYMPDGARDVRMCASCAGTGNKNAEIGRERAGDPFDIVSNVKLTESESRAFHESLKEKRELPASVIAAAKRSNEGTEIRCKNCGGVGSVFVEGRQFGCARCMGTGIA